MVTVNRADVIKPAERSGSGYVKTKPDQEHWLAVNR